MTARPTGFLFNFFLVSVLSLFPVPSIEHIGGTVDFYWLHLAPMFSISVSLQLATTSKAFGLIMLVLSLEIILCFSVCVCCVMCYFFCWNGVKHVCLLACQWDEHAMEPIIVYYYSITQDCLR